MKLHFTLFLLSFITIISLKAQEYDNYDISNYNTPDIIRNSLDFTISSKGRHSNNDFNSTKSDYFEGNIQAEINHFTSTRKRFSSLNASLTMDASGNRNETENIISKSSFFSPDLYLYNLNKFYNPNNSFFSMGGAVEWSSIQHKLQESKESSEQSKISLQVGVGKGRLESVEDARQAVYIIENLSKKGVFTRNLSDEEIFTLSQLISTVKNKRFFDSRLHLIEEISQVDSFFTENKLLENVNASYFTTLYDYWQHGALFERFSGKEFHSFISGRLSRSKYEIELNGDETTNYFNNNYRNFHWVNQFNYEKPINLFWQNSIFASFDIGCLQQKLIQEGNYSNWEDQMKYMLSGSYVWNYYPNTRTNFSIWASQALSFTHLISSLDSERTYENGGKSIDTYTALNSSLNYYISQHLRLNVSLSANYSYQKGVMGIIKEESIFSNTFLSGGITLTYSIY